MKTIWFWKVIVIHLGSKINQKKIYRNIYVHNLLNITIIFNVIKSIRSRIKI
jgi:hypothetical protein